MHASVPALDAVTLSKFNVNTESANIKSNFKVQQFQKCDPYVSSNFEDFVEEFKYLHDEVFPKLNALCQKRGARFSPVDPRRMVVESRSSTEFAFKHALDSIVECSPFFMAIFGHRYGFHKPPDADDLAQTMLVNVNMQLQSLTTHDRNLINAGRYGHPWVLDREFQKCSILELEIEAALFRDPDFSKYCFFYMRDFKHSYLKKTGSWTNFEKEDSGKQMGDIAADMSVTSSSLFEAESKYAEHRLNRLKKRIAKSGWNIIHFTTVEELGKAVFENWSSVICQLYPLVSSLTEFISQHWCIESMTNQLTRKYVSFENLQVLFDALNEHISPVVNNNDVNIVNNDFIDEDAVNAPKYGDGLFSTTDSFIQSLKSISQAPAPVLTKNIFVLVGDPGSGKSTSLSEWLKQFDDHNSLFPPVHNFSVIMEFIGSSHRSRDIGAFLRRAVKTLREAYRKRKMTSTELLEDTKSYGALVSAFQECIKLVPCIILIDSLNDLTSSMNQDVGIVKKLNWLPEVIPPTCKFVISTRRSDLSYKAITERQDIKVFWMSILSKDEKLDVFYTHLSKHALHISKKNIDTIVGNRLSEKPLYLNSLADLVSSCYTSNDVSQVIEKCTELRTIRDFWRTVINLWTRRFSWTKNSDGQPGSCRSRSFAAGWVADALRLIACSRNGLLPKEILHLLSLLGYVGRTAVLSYDWFIFQKAVGNSFTIHPEGRVLLSHTELRHAVKYNLLGPILQAATSPDLGQASLKQQHHMFLATYFLRYGSLERKLVELAWHLEQAFEWMMLCQVLCKPRFFQSFCEAAKTQPGLQEDLVRYWKKLDEAGYHPNHNLQVMVEKCEGIDEFMRTSSILPLGNKDRKFSLKYGKTTSSVFSAAPFNKSSVITSDTPDERWQGTVGSRSEIGDSDFVSEAGFGNFNIPRVDTGWTSIDDPQQPIDDSPMNFTQSTELNYLVCMFLELLGGEFLQFAKDGLFIQHQRLLEWNALPAKQKMIHFKIICGLTKRTQREEDIQVLKCYCENALKLGESLPLYLVPLSSVQKSELNELRGMVYLRLADICIEEGHLVRAERLLSSSVDILKKSKSISLEFSFTLTCARLSVSQRQFNTAETLFKQAFTDRLQWFGTTHISVAEALHELGDLYANVTDKRNIRISLLSYKQALYIYQSNSQDLDEADLLYKIGNLLVEESCLRSIQEAKACLEHALDIYLTRLGSNHEIVFCIAKSLKKISFDLRSGLYNRVKREIRDEKINDRPYSELSWHAEDLAEMLKLKSESGPPFLRKRMLFSAGASPRRTMSAMSEPYSSYNTYSYAKRTLVTPKYAVRRSTSSATTRVIKSISRMMLSSNGQHRLEKVPSKQVGLPHLPDYRRIQSVK